MYIHLDCVSVSNFYVFSKSYVESEHTLELKCVPSKKIEQLLEIGDRYVFTNMQTLAESKGLTPIQYMSLQFTSDKNADYKKLVSLFPNEDKLIGELLFAGVSDADVSSGESLTAFIYVPKKDMQRLADILSNNKQFSAIQLRIEDLNATPLKTDLSSIGCKGYTWQIEFSDNSMTQYGTLQITELTLQI